MPSGERRGTQRRIRNVLFHSFQTIRFILSDPSLLQQAKKSLTEWHDAMEERRDLKMVQRKQLTKERDGFCRNIDSYDGSVIIIDGALILHESRIRNIGTNIRSSYSRSFLS